MSLLSVIVPIYKVEKYLDECVQSILQQTFEDFEVILVDDGSPDRCPVMCDSYAKQDDRIVVIHKVNGGLSDARNEGIKVARGEYVLFIDSDDRYMTHDGFAELAKRINLYHEDIIQLATVNVCQDRDEVEYVRGNYNFDIINLGNKTSTIDYLYNDGQFAGSAWLICVKRSLLVNNDISFPIGVTAEDYGYLLKIITKARSYGAVDGLVYEYKKNMSCSITSKPRVSGIKGISIAVEYWKALSECPQGLNEFVAYIYMIMLLNYAGLSKEERDLVRKIVSNDLCALSKSNKFKSKVIDVCIRLIGIDNTASLLRIIK